MNVSTRALIRVLCDTPGCEEVWFTGSFVGLSPGASAHLTANHFGPCPKCGGLGHTADGVYTSTSATLFAGVFAGLIHGTHLASTAAGPGVVNGQVLELHELRDVVLEG
jgi:hypothetical protein